MNNLKHIAFIMDGNGRWAKARGLQRINGHLEGVKVIPKIVEAAMEEKIKYISFFAFSTENWNRSKHEVDFLLNLLMKNLTKKNLSKIAEKNISVKWIGFKDKMPKKIIEKINLFESLNKPNATIQVNLFFNYSGTKDLDNALKMFEKDDQKKYDIKKYLLTSSLPPIDLLVRTSGEERISNFALYDLSYAEIIFEPTYWPDYNKNVFSNNINIYKKRNRRFGKIDKE